MQTMTQPEKGNGSLPEDGALVKSIVTTNLADAIAKGYGVSLIEVLTGFKFIGQQILVLKTVEKVPICSVLRKVTVASSVHMQEIKMQSLRYGALRGSSILQNTG